MAGKFARLCLSLFLIPGISFAGQLERSRARELSEFQFIQVDKRSGRQVGAWMPGKVPGDVLTDLWVAGRLKDPYVDFNSKDALWANEYDWIYRTEFSADLSRDERLWILFHGIDYESRGALNNRDIFQHTGMFSRILVDATSLVKSGEPNELEVKLIGQGNRAHVRNNQLDQLIEQLKRRKTTKTQMSYGWDIAVELVNAGIWDQVEMFKTGPVMIEELGIRTQNSGEVSLDITLDSARAGNATLKITVLPENFREKKPVLVREFPLALKPGKSSANPEFRIPNPELWWSFDLGNPNLYRLTLELDFDGKASDRVEETFGFREIAWEQNPDAASGWKWVCRLNGKRIFLRGANWVPPDALPGRLADAKYEKLVSMAREANINIFRVWGGGNRERDIFYELADREGIMVWQEFPFACVYLPPYPRGKKFRELAEQEVSAIVRELRNHPSAALYSGGNEFVVSSNQNLVEMMRRVVSGLDPSRRFIAASPSEGDSHNWMVWHQKGSLLDYFQDQHALMSEFGLQALPALSTIEKYISPSLRWPLGKVYAHHNLEYGKILKYISALPHQESLPGYIEASQKMQAYYYQRAIEHWRIRKYRVSGTLFWMFDEPWPGMVGSVVDYELRPKLAYEQMKDSYAPLLVAADLAVRCWKPGDGLSSAIFLVNDYDREFSSLKIQAYLGGQLVEEWTADAAPDKSVKIAELAAKIPDNPPPILELFVKQGDQTLAHNLYDLSVCDLEPSSQFNRSLEKLSKKIMAGEEK